MTHFLDAVKSHYLRFSGHPLPHPVNYPELVPPGITRAVSFYVFDNIIRVIDYKTVKNLLHDERKWKTA
jgi:hypothetical protein